MQALLEGLSLVKSNPRCPRPCWIREHRSQGPDVRPGYKGNCSRKAVWHHHYIGHLSIYLSIASDARAISPGNRSSITKRSPTVPSMQPPHPSGDQSAPMVLRAATDVPESALALGLGYRPPIHRQANAEMVSARAGHCSTPCIPFQASDPMIGYAHTHPSNPMYPGALDAHWRADRQGRLWHCVARV